MRGFRRSSGLWMGAVLIGFSAAATIHSQVVQAQLPECQPPRPEEYLLLVPNRQTNTQSELQRLLPNNAVLTPCNYLNDQVIRVEGFASAEIASAWAKYLLDAAGLQSFVSRPAAVATAPSPAPSPVSSPLASPAPSPAPNLAPSPLPSPLPSPVASPVPNPAAGGTSSSAVPPVAPASPFPVSPTPASPVPQPQPSVSPSPVAVASPAPAASPSVPSAPATPQLVYNPQPLGSGFAVVVNYFSDPDIANRVRQVTAREVGLVAFEQQPYLLASYTTDAAAASTLLKTLSERGLTAAIVDSRRTVLLTPAVRLGQ
jgi:hypothetical protein